MTLRKWLRGLWSGELLDHIVVLLMKGLLYHSAVCVLYNLSSEKSVLMDLKLLVLYVPFILFFIYRIKCNNFFAFLLFHAFTSGVFILLFSDKEARILTAIFVLGMAAASVYKRLSGEWEEICPPPAAYLVFFVMYLAAMQGKRQAAMQICFFEAFLFLILFFAYRNISGTTAFLKTNDSIKNLPAGQLKYLNRMMLGFFIFFLTAGMFFVPYLPVGTLFNGIGELLRLLIRGLILFILWLADRKEPETGLLEQNTESSVTFAEAGETSALAQVLGQIFLTAFTALLAAGILYFAGRLLYKMYQRFYDQHRETTDESEFLWKTPVHKERIARKRQKTEHVAPIGINQKIRRLYKKRIQRQFGTKSVMQPAWTPTEWESALRQAQEEPETAKLEKQIQARIVLYEKARYSQHECEKQELEIMKQNLKLKK